MIESLSVVVPCKGKCINDCKFCVSKMKNIQVEDMIGSPNLYSKLYTDDYVKRLDYARSNGCNTLLITGATEPQQNFYFLEKLGFLIEKMKNPFEKIEFQTTTTGLTDEWLNFLRHSVGVNTISVSISSFDDKENNFIIGTRDEVALGFNTKVSGKINLKKICKRIKKYNFNLRLSVNLTNTFENMKPKEILEYANKELKADQITFRVLYKSSDDKKKWTPEDYWIKENGLTEKKISEIQKYVYKNGRFDRILEFGQMVYFVENMSTVIDDDCMDSAKFKNISREIPNLNILEISNALKKELDKRNIRYLILRENCKLYSNWETLVAYY